MWINQWPIYFQLQIWTAPTQCRNGRLAGSSTHIWMNKWFSPNIFPYLRKRQCDQMARLCFQCWPFTMKLCQTAIFLPKVGSKFCLILKWDLKKLPETFIICLRWQRFAESGHTAKRPPLTFAVHSEGKYLGERLLGLHLTIMMRRRRIESSVFERRK